MPDCAFRCRPRIPSRRYSAAWRPSASFDPAVRNLEFSARRFHQPLCVCTMAEVPCACADEHILTPSARCANWIIRGIGTLTRCSRTGGIAFADFASHDSHTLPWSRWVWHTNRQPYCRHGGFSRRVSDARFSPVEIRSGEGHLEGGSAEVRYNAQDHPVRAVEQPLPNGNSRTRCASVGSSQCTERHRLGHVKHLQKAIGSSFLRP